MENGEVFLWGNNYKKRLGDQGEDDKGVQVSRLNGFEEAVVQVACSSTHTIFLGARGRVYTVEGGTGA